MKLSFARIPRASFYREARALANANQEAIEIDQNHEQPQMGFPELQVEGSQSSCSSSDANSEDELSSLVGSDSEWSVKTDRDVPASATDVFLVEMATAIRYVKSWKCLETDLKNRRILGDERYSWDSKYKIFKELKKSVSLVHPKKVDCPGSRNGVSGFGEMTYLPFTQRLISSLISLQYTGKTIKLHYGFDGVQIYKTSDSQFWVLGIGVLGTRIKLAVALWMGQGYPDVECMLKNFTEELNVLFERGKIPLSENDDECPRFPVKHWLVGCCDGPAKAHLRARKAAGYYGCAYCEREGVTRQSFLKFDRDNTVIYPELFAEPVVERLRTNEREQIYGAMAFEQNVSNGNCHVKGCQKMSPLSDINNYDLILDLPVGYLHCVCLADIRMICEMMRKESSAFYLGGDRHIKAMENDIVTISLPHFLRRRGRRSITSTRQLKASEFRFFLLYLAPLLVRKTSPFAKSTYSRCRDNILLLSTAVNASMTPNFAGKTVEQITEMFERWVHGFGELAGQEYLTVSPHSTKHIGMFLKIHGPINRWAEFSWEYFYGRMARFVTGPNQPILQVIFTIAMKPHKCN